jgi:cell division protein FtsZ
MAEKPVESKPLEVVNPDYSQLDRPKFMRTKGANALKHEASLTKATSVAPSEDRDMDYLDIPAFLRRQAD